MYLFLREQSNGFQITGENFMRMSTGDFYRKKVLLLCKFKLQISLSEISGVFTVQFWSFIINSYKVS